MAIRFPTADEAIRDEFRDDDNRHKLNQCLEAARLAYVAMAIELGYGDLPARTVLIQPMLIVEPRDA